MKFTRLLMWCFAASIVLIAFIHNATTVILKKTALLITAFILFATGTFAQSSNEIIGKWKAEDDSSKLIEIYLAKDGFYYGKANNPRQTGYGKTIMNKLQYDAGNKTYKGTMTPTDMDMTLNVTISFLSKIKLKVVAKKFIMSKTIYLIRLN